MNRLRRHIPPLLLISPSLVLIAIFVYGLIGANFYTSSLNMNTSAQTVGKEPSEFVGLANYQTLFSNPDFIFSLRNLLIFTIAFLAGTLIIGFVWAWVLEHPLKGEGIFRSLFLFPMAISFVASGVVWRWLLDPQIGPRAKGLNRLFQMVGLDFLQNNWWDSIGWGILAIALPAVWQLSGYVMALFLAGFRGIPEELREAARIDGASEWKMYRYVIFPQLSPVALSAIIVIGHMSLKAFDLIMSIAGQNVYTTRVPQVDMFNFQTTYQYSMSAAVGAILLVIVAALVIPYLVHDSKSRK